MLPDEKQRLVDPEAYIHFVHYQDIEATTCVEDLKNWYRFTNLACLQIESSKSKKSDAEQKRLEEIRARGVEAMQRIGQKMRNLGINPV